MCCHRVVCLQIAVDFVSPESMLEALGNREQLRTADLAIEQELELNPEDRIFQEKLQSQLMLVRGVLRAAELVDTGVASTVAERGGGKAGRRGGKASSASRKGRPGSK